MIDLDRLKQLQLVGGQEIQELPQREQDALIGYSALVAKECLNFSKQHGTNPWELVNNAFRFGMCLGLNMKIENGEVKER